MRNNTVKTFVRKLVPEKQRLQLWYAFFRLRGYYYRGRAVECPCCEGHFRRFLAYGATKRPDAVCPSCHSLERHRMLWLYLQRETKVFTDRLRLLHFAPEPIIQKRLRDLPQLDYTSADLYSPLAMEKVDIMALPYPDSSFDVMLCSHVLAHVEDDKKAMAEMLRVLRPGGYALIQSQLFPTLSTTLEVPEATTPEQRLQAYGQEDRCRNYGADYKDRLQEAGFEAQQIDYSLAFSPLERKKYGLDRQDYIFHCNRPQAH